MGDRFAHEAEAQLAACIAAKKLGVEIVPVWNKSNREHNIIGSEPTSTRAAADAAVKSLGWTAPYFLDADHIGLKTVDRFVGVSDFFTIDVADFIAQPADPAAVKAFVDRHPELVGTITLAGIDRPFTTTRADVERTAAKFLLAVQEAGKVYRHIVTVKGVGRFVPEISMDETDSPQTPPELLVISPPSPTKACRSRRSPRSSPAVSTRALITSATSPSSSASSMTTSASSPTR